MSTATCCSGGRSKIFARSAERGGVFSACALRHTFNGQCDRSGRIVRWGATGAKRRFPAQPVQNQGVTRLARRNTGGNRGKW